jgi:hypothetical protein
MSTLSYLDVAKVAPGETNALLRIRGKEVSCIDSGNNLSANITQYTSRCSSAILDDRAGDLYLVVSDVGVERAWRFETDKVLVEVAV